MSIYPVDHQWIHTYLLEPYLEGVQRVNRAWAGVDFSSQAQPVLNLKERLISWLIGTALLIPLLNLVLWVVWRALGRPEKLSDPYSQENNLPDVLSQLLTFSLRRKKPAETLIYLEKYEGKEVRVSYRKELRPEGEFKTVQTSDQFRTDAHYTANGQISTYRYMTAQKTFNACLKGRSIEIEITSQEKKTLPLEEPLPWIQQSTFGFHEFIRSDATERVFYSVLFEHQMISTPRLVKLKATKMEIKDGLQKVTVTALNLPLSVTGILWFHPERGILQKFTDPAIRPSNEPDGILQEHHPLPEPERP